MKKKKLPEKSQSELDRESKEFLEKNARELKGALVKYCTEFNLDFEPPFTSEESKEILKVAKQGEFEKLLKTFPNYLSLSESQKMNAKLIVKFNLPRNLSLRDGPAIQKAISEVLKKRGGLSEEVDPALCKFKR